MRKKWTIEQRIYGQNQRAKKAGTRHDLTLEQWLETLEYFNYKCAYCGKQDYEFIEHYLPVGIAGTTVSNCVPACARCNVFKDAKSHINHHRLTLYQNERVLAFIENKGVKIAFHVHEYKVIKEKFMSIYCDGCGNKIVLAGFTFDEAHTFINEYCKNTGYAYLA